MKTTNRLVLGALGIGALFVLLSADSSDEPESPKEPTDKPKPAPPPTPTPPKPAQPVDPLPEYPLSQQSIIEALVDGLKDGQTMKLRSVVAKSSTASPALRAYLLASMNAVPVQMKADAQFVKDFSAKEGERLERLRNDPDIKSLNRYVHTTKALQADVAALIPQFGKTVLALSNLIFGAITDHFYDPNLDGSKPRKGEDQIIPGYEGRGIRRGVRFTPDLPYVSKAERALADKVRDRWYVESDSSALFQQLPSVPDKTTFLYAPTYQDFLDAIDKLRIDGIVK